MAERAFDVTYASADLEIAAADVLFPGQAEVRLKLINHAPAALMLSSAILYWFILVPHCFPALRPSTALAKARLSQMRDVHNFALFLFSAVCCISTAVHLWRDGQLFVAGSWVAVHCRSVEGTWLRPMSILFLLSKMWEWGDTLFLVVLGSRPPEFLHLYHHATTFWLFCFVVNQPGPEKFGLLLNGGVHMLMYSHYWRSWPKPLVPFITIAQIAQLAFVTYSWSVTSAVCPQARFARAASEHPLEFATVYAMVPVYLWFFLVFFAKRFLGIGRSKKLDGKPHDPITKKGRKVA